MQTMKRRHSGVPWRLVAWLLAAILTMVLLARLPCDRTVLWSAHARGKAPGYTSVGKGRASMILQSARTREDKHKKIVRQK
jgi:hypothetical protein